MSLPTWSLPHVFISYLVRQLTDTFGLLTFDYYIAYVLSYFLSSYGMERALERVEWNLTLLCGL